MSKIKEIVIERKESKRCPRQTFLAIYDTMQVLQGKWKIPIIATLLCGKFRFNELNKGIPEITPRMLSKELKELELCGIIKREVIKTAPMTVEYQLTEIGFELENVIDKIMEWGLDYRKKSLE